MQAYDAAVFRCLTAPLWLGVSSNNPSPFFPSRRVLLPRRAGATTHVYFGRLATWLGTRMGE